MKRYVATFFRYWLIALIPIVVLPLVVLATTIRSSASATAGANIWISSATRLGYADYNVTPAQNFANVAGQLLESSSFVGRVAQQSRLYVRQAATQRDPKTWEETDLQKNVKFLPKGPNFVSISYTTKVPAVGVQVLQGVINTIPTELERFNRVGRGMFTVVDPPAAQPASVGKRVLLLLLLIPLLVGVVVSAAFVVVKTALDRSIRRPDEVQQLLGLPLLAIVPYHAPANASIGPRQIALVAVGVDANMEPRS